MHGLLEFKEQNFAAHMDPFEFRFTKQTFDKQKFAEDALEIMGRPELNDKVLKSQLEADLAWVLSEPHGKIHQMLESPEGLKELADEVDAKINGADEVVIQHAENVDKNVHVQWSDELGSDNADGSKEGQNTSMDERIENDNPWRKDKRNAKKKPEVASNDTKESNPMDSLLSKSVSGGAKLDEDDPEGGSDKGPTILTRESMEI